MTEISSSRPRLHQHDYPGRRAIGHMEIVEDTLDVALETFLARPLFCFLGTVTGDEPRVSPLWFLWEDGAIWIIADEGKTYPQRVRDTPATAIAIVDFDRSSGSVQHVGMRGRSVIRPHDPDRAIRLLTKYLGEDMKAWDGSRFPDPHTWSDEMAMIRFDPETVVARDQSYVPAPSISDP